MQQTKHISVLYHSLIARFMSIPAGPQPSGPVSIPQMKLLMVVDFKGSATLGEVAAMLGVSQGAASELVDKLVRAGFVSRERSERDRRAVELKLRSRGRAILARLEKTRLQKVRKLLTVLSPRDTRRMVSSLEALNEILAKWHKGGKE